MEIIEWIKNSARSFIFSTALPSCVIAASLKALELVIDSPVLIEKLWKNHGRLIRNLENIGINTGSEVPIIPLKIGDIEDTLEAAQYLYDRGIYAPAIRPPTVKEPRLRITVTAGHTEADIDLLTEVLSEVKKKKRDS